MTAAASGNTAKAAPVQPTAASAAVIANQTISRTNAAAITALVTAIIATVTVLFPAIK